MTTSKTLQGAALAALIVTCSAAHAQFKVPGGAPAAPAEPAATAPPAPAAPVSKAKKELVAKVLQLQRPGVENAARILGEQPAQQMLMQARMALQRSSLSDEKKQQIAKDIQADANKYVDEVSPLLVKRAVELAPSTIGPILEQKFSEAELKQLVVILQSEQSPVYRKYQSLGGEMQRALGEKLVPELRPSIDPKVAALHKSIADRLSPPAPASPSASGPASGPAK